MSIFCLALIMGLAPAWNPDNEACEGRPCDATFHSDDPVNRVEATDEREAWRMIAEEGPWRAGEDQEQPAPCKLPPQPAFKLNVQGTSSFTITLDDQVMAVVMMSLPPARDELRDMTFFILGVLGTSAVVAFIYFWALPRRR